ncbi:hypothetical protein DEH69_23035 [Streptomyces sp. PT12]|nr:hypothetical protein DEH69_23035 [Streptomyces sp. PT12]
MGIGMAAGEVILWPHLTTVGGLGLLWLALTTIVIQTGINLEIERYTLATGQTVVAGLSRWWTGWGVLICLAAAFQYMWPGWATSGTTVLTYAVDGGDVVVITVVALVAMGALLTVSPVIYRTMERAELIKVAVTLLFLAVIVVAVLTWQTWGDAAEETVTGIGRIPDEVTFTMLLGGLGAAGAGGVHNLVLSNWIRDKGYGMGAHVPRLVSPVTGREEASGSDRYTFPQDEINLARWRVWWRRANVEHIVSFGVVCLLTISLMCMLAYQTLHGQDDITSDPAFLRTQAEILGTEVGDWMEILFYSVAVVSLWAASLGMLDIMGRVVSDFVKRTYLARSAFWTEGRLYVAAVWTEIAFGSVILLSGVNQPLSLLLISTCTASVVTLLYSVLLVRLNRKDLPRAIRLRGGRLAFMLLAIGFYGFFATAMVITQLRDRL